MFIPNTYETYWNTSAVKFRDKMIKEYRNILDCWSRDKSERTRFNNYQAILASIVHKESVKKRRKTKNAGVYLNRLRLGMPLQADPTVFFAIKGRITILIGCQKSIL
jgi:UPF0755 protein